jgi:hypothetical protein
MQILTQEQLWTTFAAAALGGIMANPVRWTDIQRRYDRKEMTYDEASAANAAKAASLADAMITEYGRRYHIQHEG